MVPLNLWVSTRVGKAGIVNPFTMRSDLFLKKEAFCFSRRRKYGMTSVLSKGGIVALTSASGSASFAETFQAVMLWILLGVAVALIIAGAIIAAAKRKAVAPYAKIAAPAFFLYAVIALASIKSVAFAEESAAKAPAALDVFQLVITWISVAVCVALVAIGAIVYAVKRGAFARFLKVTAVGVVVYAVAVAITMLAWTLADNSDSYAGEGNMLASHVLVPIIIVCGIILASTILLAVLRAKNSRAFKPAAVVCGLLLLASVIVAAVLIGGFYGANIKDDGYYNSDTASVNNAALYISMGVLIVVIVLIGTGGRRGIDTRTIATAAICIALSFALSYIKLFDMPFGGAVTFASLLPVLVFSYIYGVRRGLMVGFIYGMLQAIQDPYIIHPAQFLLDYPIAFSFVSLGGSFARFKPLSAYPQVKFAIGAILAGIGRYISHVLSGVFAFSAYAADYNMAALPYSLAYNSFVFIDLVIAVAAGVILFSSRTFMRSVVDVLSADVAKRHAAKNGTSEQAAPSDEGKDGNVTAQSDGLANSDTAAKDDKRA